MGRVWGKEAWRQAFVPTCLDCRYLARDDGMFHSFFFCVLDGERCGERNYKACEGYLPKY